MTPVDTESEEKAFARDLTIVFELIRSDMNTILSRAAEEQWTLNRIETELQQM